MKLWTVGSKLCGGWRRRLDAKKLISIIIIGQWESDLENGMRLLGVDWRVEEDDYIP
jgi:hypothetical protein